MKEKQNKFRCKQPCLFSLINQQSLEPNKPILIISGSCKTDSRVLAEHCTGQQQRPTSTGNVVIPPRHVPKHSVWTAGLILLSQAPQLHQLWPAQWGNWNAPLTEAVQHQERQHEKAAYFMKIWNKCHNFNPLSTHQWEKGTSISEAEAGPGPDSICVAKIKSCFCKINTRFSIHEVTNCHLLFLIKPYFIEYRTNFIIQLKKKTLSPSV